MQYATGIGPNKNKGRGIDLHSNETKPRSRRSQEPHLAVKHAGRLGDLSPSLAGGVRLLDCVSSFVSLHLSPRLAGSVRLSGCLSSLLFSSYSSQSCWWRLALWLFVFTCLPGVFQLYPSCLLNVSWIGFPNCLPIAFPNCQRR